MENTEQEITRSLQIHDPDHYFSTIFAPKDKRPALLTIYAFNRDLERIPDSVSEPMLGEIRLQWWRDAIENRQSSPTTGNPLADRLISIITEYKLPVIRIQELIDARSFELSGEPMPDIQSLKNYIKKTEEALCILSCRILSDNQPDNINELAKQASFCYKASTLLASDTINRAKGRQYLPQGQPEHIQSEIDEQYHHFQSTAKTLPSKFGPAFLPVTLIEGYLKQSKIRESGKSDRPVQLNPAYRLWKYWKTQAFGNY